ncbi:acyl-CoA dehydrogenase family protein [Mycolicibacterium palauense]|uniref:acyl-CoA dehydrogenase family protein n=1 Tax=Mycolicibacterium palauense TaxID=2034511 RepID=UPI000BFED912|nr:acyl-CoA dehydrogenase family protein [Mycolicibacterium palauense]
MAWDFETDPEFQRKLDWMDGFVRDEIEPLELLLGDPFDRSDHRSQSAAQPLVDQVKEQGLWACHLGPELGGQGYGQVKLALMNEILGRSRWAPSIFGCQAPDSGNAEILAHFGSDEQKERYLRPLLDGLISSAFSMTEPAAGADPLLFTTRADRTSDGWILNGEKWFVSNASVSAFHIVMAVTDPDAEPHRRMSMFVVPADTPGVQVVRDVHTLSGHGTEGDHHSTHAFLRYSDVQLPESALLGERGSAFAIAQTRLGGGRVHHAMRTIGMLRAAFDMMCERAVSRRAGGGTLADLQMTKEKVADSWIEIEQFRLLVLRTAWLIDKHRDYRMVRKDIAAVKAIMPKVLHDVVQRALHLHGALGISTEMPFSAMLLTAEVMGTADGPTEVHKLTLGKAVLKNYQPAPGVFPTAHLPTRREAAVARFADRIEALVLSDSPDSAVESVR